MPMFSLVVNGSYLALENGLKHFLELPFEKAVWTYAREGQIMLAKYTPVDTGLAADSWWYDVTVKGSLWEISWGNSDIENGFHVAIMRQYGYVTGSGIWVEGLDYIGPALDPTIDKIINAVWQEVMNA